MRLSARLTAAVTGAGLVGGISLAVPSLIGTAKQAPANVVAAARTEPAGTTSRAVGTTSATSGAPSATSFAVPAQTTAAAPAGISAKGAYLYDVGKAKKLWGRATTTVRALGSTTKVMTALIVLQSGQLDRTVTIKQSYADHVKNNDASSAGLRVGDKLTVRQLLNAMMLPSGCDAAYALGDVFGPGQTKFVAKMNKEAAKLGMKQTHFINVDGLPSSKKEEEDTSTPHDMIVLTRTAIKNADFRAVVARKTYTLAKSSSHNAYTWTNTNLLLGSYSGAVGIKTGHTNKAGYCLLFETVRNGRTLVGLVLNSTTTNQNKRFEDAAAMLDWAFGTKTARVQLRSLPAGAPTD